MTQLDRFARLESLDPDELTRWLNLAPVVERLAFDPSKQNVRVTKLMGAVAPQGAKTVEDLASIVDSGTGGMAVIRGLDATAYKLLLQAVWSGGTLSRNAVLCSTGWPKDPESASRMEVGIEAAAERLRFLLLAQPPQSSLPSESTRTVPASEVSTRSKVADRNDGPSELTWLRIVDDTRALVTLPGVSLRDGLSIIPADDLAAVARSHGIGWNPSQRKLSATQSPRPRADVFVFPQQGYPVAGALRSHGGCVPGDRLGLGPPSFRRHRYIDRSRSEGPFLAADPGGDRR